MKSGNRWWFKYDSKTQQALKSSKNYPTNTWVTIKGKRYHFDAKGYMHTKWQKLNNKWYFFGSDGAMKTGWQKSSGKWYFMASDGVMKTGWLDNGGKRYYLNGSGAMVKGWQKLSNTWYYFNGSGVMSKGWTKVKGKWYFLDTSSGAMKTGWLDNGGQRYLLNSSGAMLAGWAKLGGKWYYFNKSGYMQKSKWISGKYWVGSDGVMATSSWVDNGKYYVDSAGKWVKQGSSAGKQIAVNKLTSKTWITHKSIKPREYQINFYSDGTYTQQFYWLKYPYSSNTTYGRWKYAGMENGSYRYNTYNTSGVYDGYVCISSSGTMSFVRSSGSTIALY
ncbi:hypothetical protein [Anaerotardibacter muris]|uniref:hypothetical protein n=1 Tax=Anaerotardibacter muris TaxID=2941505 RepID=UPI00203F9BA5|nr:hypothetical protein [Anaerotardibacter muris]